MKRWSRRWTGRREKKEGTLESYNPAFDDGLVLRRRTPQLSQAVMYTCDEMSAILLDHDRARHSPDYTPDCGGPFDLDR